MADNTVINVGSGGDTIADDDIGGVKFQRIKLIHGVDGTNDGDVSNTNPLPVSVRNSQQWYGPTAVPGVAAAAYASLDQFGTLITLTNAARATGGGGFITGISFSDGDDLITGLDMFFFHDTPSLAADNGVFSLSDADTDKILWIARLTTFEDLPLNKVNTQLMGISIPYFCTGTSLFVAIRIFTAYTLVSTSSPKYKISLLRD